MAPDGARTVSRRAGAVRLYGTQYSVLDLYYVRRTAVVVGRAGHQGISLSLQLGIPTTHVDHGTRRTRIK
jgi:hypothetical protein